MDRILYIKEGKQGDIIMKNRKTVLLAATAAAVIATVGIGGTLAYFTDADNGTSNLVTGKVDISLSEAPKESIKIMPNQTIALEPTVKVEADSENSYLRVKLDVSYDGTTSDKNYAQELENALQLQTEHGMEALGSENSGWIKGADGYYYLQESKKPGEQAAVFSQFTVPEDWNNEIVGKTFQIQVQAEAIQSDYFNADQDGNGVIDSWNDTKGAAVSIQRYGVGK